jgi:predicted nuclease with RNAse H fold
MSATGSVWIGADPGGENNFGLAILKTDGSAHVCCVDYVDMAIEVVREHVQGIPGGVGVDSPLWWTSGRAGLRVADQHIRDKYGLPSRNVQATNSMWGSVLVQGMMFVARIRELFPDVRVTETHPKAVLKALDLDEWKRLFDKLPTDVTLDMLPEHKRDAVISAIAAREGFENRWPMDLAVNRGPSEQDPLHHWLAPIHYYWPDR